jgi:thiamine biosynthesis lipoprotein
VDSLDAILSDYRPESELSRFSAAAQEGSARAQVSKDLYRVLKFSQQVARETKGAFDVSVGPFVRLWRRSRRQGQLPDKGRLATAAAAVGYEKLLLDEKTQQATLSVPGMRLDLGGVAKGYILDQAMEALKSCGIQRALLDGGGDLLASGPPPGQKAWRVTIGAFQSDTSPAAPESTRNGFNLVNSALATSGDAFQFVLIEGVRYSHLIDPTSGLGLTTQRAATVHAPNAMSADAWASALCVLDAKAGIQRLDGMPRLSARCLSPAGVHDSEGFPANLFTQDSRAAE